MAHFDGDINDLIERKEYGNLQQYRPTTRNRVDFLGLVQLHHRLLLLLLVVGVFFLDLHHFRLRRLHMRHGHVGFIGKREENHLDDNRCCQNGEAEVSEEAEKPVHHIKHRFGDEIEPTPVDHQIKLADFAILLIGVDFTDFLGTRKKQALNGFGRTWCHSYGIRKKIRLVARTPVIEVGEARLERLLCRRDQRGGPILIGNAEPAVGGLCGLYFLVFFNRGIVDFLQACLTSHAD